MRVSAFKLFISFVILFFSASVWCQELKEYNFLRRLTEYRWSQGEINIILDERIEDNFNQHLQYNYKNSVIPGFRIRIFSDSGFDAKERALETRTRFMSKYENIEAYIQYDIPNYKVYVGDCRLRSEALRILEIIKKDFPNAFIVMQNINIAD